MPDSAHVKRIEQYMRLLASSTICTILLRHVYILASLQKSDMPEFPDDTMKLF
jgi:hypothetical protein